MSDPSRQPSFKLLKSLGRIGTFLGGVAAVCGLVASQSKSSKPVEVDPIRLEVLQSSLSPFECWQVAVTNCSRAKEEDRLANEELGSAVAEESQLAAALEALERENASLPLDLEQLAAELREKSLSASEASERANAIQSLADQKTAAALTLEQRLPYDLASAEVLVDHNIDAEKLKNEEDLQCQWASRDKERRRIGAIVSDRDQSEIQAYYRKLKALNRPIDQSRGYRVNLEVAKVQGRLLSEQYLAGSLVADARTARSIADAAAMQVVATTARIQSASERIVQLPANLEKARLELLAAKSNLKAARKKAALAQKELMLAQDTLKAANQAVGSATRTVAIGSPTY